MAYTNQHQQKSTARHIKGSTERAAICLIAVIAEVLTAGVQAVVAGVAGRAMLVIIARMKEQV